MTNRLSRYIILFLLVTFPLCAERVKARNHEVEGFGHRREGQWKESFVFVQMADPQLGMFEANQGWDQEIENLNKAATSINALRPRFVVVCGDLVNAFPWEPMNQRQRRDFKKALRRFDPQIPLICLCGNHDVGNRPTAPWLASYRKDFGDDFFGFWVGGVRFLALNSNLYFDPSGAPGEAIEQSRWLIKELAAALNHKAVHIIVLQHHPWFLSDPLEQDNYFNIPQVRRKPALALLQTAGVRAVFAGHYHGNSWGKLGNMEMVTTGPIGMPLRKEPSGYRVVKVHKTHLEHQYCLLDGTPYPANK